MSKHSIAHIELSAADPHAAGKFYAEVFGWDVEFDENMNYVMFKAPDSPGGGFNIVNESFPAGTVMLYIATESIEDTLAHIIQLGGKAVVPKTEIPTIGWFAVFADPTGNHVGLFTPLMHQ